MEVVVVVVVVIVTGRVRAGSMEEGTWARSADLIEV